MSKLYQVQQDFQSYLLGQCDAQSMLPHIAERPGLSVDDRLGIYYNAYRIRLCEALSEAYEKTHIYLGDELFEKAALAYIDAHPSETRNMRWFGQQFAGFLRHWLNEFPAVAELAEFEWTLNLAFDAQDENILNLSDIAKISEAEWNAITFRCVASHYFLHFHWNSVAIWVALNQEETPPAPTSSDAPQIWLIWRNQLQPNFRSVKNEEFQALTGMQEGKSFSQVCATAAENNPAAITQIAAWLQTWIGEALLTNLEIEAF